MAMIDSLTVQSATAMRPGLLSPIGAHSVLVVDRLQPAAVLVGPSAEVTAVVEWPDRDRPPRDTDGSAPGRLTSVTGNGVLILDVGSTVAVSVEINRAGGLQWSASECRAAELSLMRSSHRGVHEASGKTWSYRSHHDQYRSRTVVRLDTDRQATNEWSVDRATPVSSALLGDSLLIVLRRAHKRPWDFDPRHELWKFSATGEPASVISMPALSTAWLPYENHVSDQAVTIAFEQAQRGADTVAEAAAATDIDIVVAVRMGQPQVALSFDVPDGRRLCRIDRPFNPLGQTTGGLVGQSIWLDDDLTGGILEPGAVDGTLI
jgi:hypothetical protein